MSDVFVVPNLNVAYETWVTVDWDKDACKVRLVVTGKDSEGKDIIGLPTKISFDITADGNKPALSFYSRFHLLDLKKPELEDAVFKLKLELDGKVCPISDDEDCTKLKAIEEGLEGWNKALDIETTGLAQKMSIVDWFTTIGTRDMYDNSQLDYQQQAEEQSSSLISPSLGGGAVKINTLGKDGLDQINRIQFDGGAGQIEMTMSKEKTESYTGNSCWLGCSVESDLSAG